MEEDEKSNKRRVEKRRKIFKTEVQMHRSGRTGDEQNSNLEFRISVVVLLYFTLY